MNKPTPTIDAAIRWWEYLYVVPLMPLFVLVVWIMLREWRPCES